jgi:hypothetical protein
MCKFYAMVLVLACVGVSSPRLVRATCGCMMPMGPQPLGPQGEFSVSDAAQVVLMRHGTTTAVTMQVNYQGPLEDFSMVVPVPVVLQKEDIKTLSPDIFSRIDRLTAPRLEQLWEQDPCFSEKSGDGGFLAAAGGPNVAMDSDPSDAETSTTTDPVQVKATFDAGEYEIVVLGTEDSTALESWLQSNGYAIPSGASSFLDPYVSAGAYFFVAKINIEKVTFKNGNAILSPLRMNFQDDAFKLPIRLGLMNAQGEQDLVAYTLGLKQRYQLANRENILMPTDVEVVDSVSHDFGGFVDTLFSAVQKAYPNSAVTEFAGEMFSLNHDHSEVIAWLESRKELHENWLRSVTACNEKETQGNNDEEDKDGDGYPAYADCNDFDSDVHPGTFESCNDDIDNNCDGVICGFDETRPPLDNDATSSTATNCDVDPENLPDEFFYNNSPWGTQQGGPRRLNAGLGDDDFQNLGQELLNLGSEGETLQWTLSRIHLRYDADTTGDDLVFEQAESIQGGFECTANDQGSWQCTPDSWPADRNLYQSRAVIRHHWTSSVACLAPKFGIWFRQVWDTDNYNLEDTAPLNGMTTVAVSPNTLGQALSRKLNNNAALLSSLLVEGIESLSIRAEGIRTTNGCACDAGGGGAVAWSFCLVVAVWRRRRRLL